MFTSILPARAKDMYQMPKGKTANDRFALLVKQRRQDDASTRESEWDIGGA